MKNNLSETDREMIQIAIMYDLAPQEIKDQVYSILKEFGQPVSHRPEHS